MSASLNPQLRGIPIVVLERECWPRMTSAWLFFEVLHRLADVEDDEAPVRLLHADTPESNGYACDGAA